MLSLSFSSWVLLSCTAPAALFLVLYGLFTKWWKDPLGWVVLLYAIAVAGLLGLLAFGITQGRPIDEPYRLAFAAFLFIALCGKLVVLIAERSKGGVEPNPRRPDPTSK